MTLLVNLKLRTIPLGGVDVFPLSKLLSHVIRVGTLTVIDANGGNHTFKGSAPGPSVDMKLDDTRLYRALFFNPELAAGEAYMDGTITFPGSSLRDFLYLLSVNRNRPGGCRVRSIAQLRPSPES